MRVNSCRRACIARTGEGRYFIDACPESHLVSLGIEVVGMWPSVSQRLWLDLAGSWRRCAHYLCRAGGHVVVGGFISNYIKVYKYAYQLSLKEAISARTRTLESQVRLCSYTTEPPLGTLFLGQLALRSVVIFSTPRLERLCRHLRLQIR